MEFYGGALHDDKDVINESQPHQRLCALPGRDGLRFYLGHEQVGQSGCHRCAHCHSLELLVVLVRETEGVLLDD